MVSIGLELYGCSGVILNNQFISTDTVHNEHPRDGILAYVAK